MIDVDSFQTRL